MFTGFKQAPLDISYKPPMDWRMARIPKKSGKWRTLHIPNDDLKAVQRQILDYLYTYDELRPCIEAVGFVPNRNVMSGVTLHDNRADMILGMDFSDFFDNVDYKLAMKELLRIGVPATVVDYIAECCTYKGKLTQGAPTSPYLANIALRQFDAYMVRFCQRRNLQYSRYADDIAISSPSVVAADSDRYNISYVVTRSNGTTTKLAGRIYRVIRGVELLVSKCLPTLRINRAKTHVSFLHGISSRRITGVVIRNDMQGYNAPRRFRYKQRAALHNIWYALKEHPEHKGKFFRDWLRVRAAITYIDMIRSYSMSDTGRTKDPKINRTKLAFVAGVYEGKENKKNGRRTDRIKRKADSAKDSTGGSAGKPAKRKAARRTE